MLTTISSSKQSALKTIVPKYLVRLLYKLKYFFFKKMKLVCVTLFFIGFVVITDAKAFKRLANGGQILSPDGRYIPGEFRFSLRKSDFQSHNK